MSKDSLFSRFTCLVGKFLSGCKTSVWQDMLLCVAITLVSGFYYYDSYAGYANVIRIIAAILLPGTWLCMSFKSGFGRKLSFEIFAMAYWLIPFIFVKWEETLTIRTYVKFVDIASEIGQVMVVSPLEKISDFLGIGTTLCMFVILLNTVAFWIFGYAAKMKLRSPGN